MIYDSPSNIAVELDKKLNLTQMTTKHSVAKSYLYIEKEHKSAVLHGYYFNNYVIMKNGLAYGEFILYLSPKIRVFKTPLRRCCVVKALHTRLIISKEPLIAGGYDRHVAVKMFHDAAINPSRELRKTVTLMVSVGVDLYDITDTITPNIYRATRKQGCVILGRNYTVIIWRQTKRPRYKAAHKSAYVGSPVNERE